jgi:hypothetical protein
MGGFFFDIIQLDMKGNRNVRYSEIPHGRRYVPSTMATPLSPHQTPQEATMRIHKTVDHFADKVNESAICPNCAEPFVIGNGIAYEGEYTKNGQWKYGYVCFCTLDCLLAITAVEGNA